MGNLIYTVGGDSNLVSCKSAAKVPFESLKVEFAPVQSASGDPSPTNIRPISGWSGVNVQKCGKNLFNKNDSTIIIDGYISSNGTITSYTDCVLICISCKPNTSYTVSKIKTGYFRVGYDSKIPNFGDKINNYITNNNATAITIITGNTAKYLLAWVFDPTVSLDANLGKQTVLDSVQIEQSLSATSYESYSITTYPVSWTSQGTIYGGYVDLVSGVLTKTWVSVDAGTIDWDLATNNAYRQAWVTDSLDIVPVNASSEPGHCISTIFKTISQSATWGPYSISGGHISVPKNIYIIFESNAYSTTEEVKAAVSGIPIVYELATPITYQLAPQQLTTLLGRNNIWSDTNGNTTVSYPLVETGAIREAKKRVLNFTPQKYIGGLPVYIDNAYYPSSNGYATSFNTDSDWFITGVFDTGSTSSKTYTLMQNPKVSSHGSAFRLYNDLTANSVDYWSNMAGSTTPNTRSVTTVGRYILFPVYKPYAENLYMYYTSGGQQIYLFKGKNVT